MEKPSKMAKNAQKNVLIQKKKKKKKKKKESQKRIYQKFYIKE